MKANEMPIGVQADKFQIQTSDGVQEFDIYTEEGFRVLSDLWTRSGWQRKISYEVTWLGIPIIQLPEDILMMQELIYKIRPDVIIDTGTAHGGTAVFYASMLELLGHGQVVSIDVEIRKYNHLAINAHPMSKRINLIEGSSIDDAVLAQVRQMIRSGDMTLLSLDSNHTYAHVSQELEQYAPLIAPGGYIVVFDSVMETLADAPNGSPEWATDNPVAAVRDFLEKHPEFEIDSYYNRLWVTYCKGSFLRKKFEPSS